MKRRKRKNQGVRGCRALLTTLRQAHGRHDWALWKVAPERMFKATGIPFWTGEVVHAEGVTFFTEGGENVGGHALGAGFPPALEQIPPDWSQPWLLSPRFPLLEQTMWTLSAPFKL